MSDTLPELGLALKENFQDWLSQLKLGDLVVDQVLTDQTIYLNQLVEDLAVHSQISHSLLNLESWLTSGFLPNDSGSIDFLQLESLPETSTGSHQGSYWNTNSSQANSSAVGINRHPATSINTRLDPSQETPPHRNESFWDDPSITTAHHAEAATVNYSRKSQSPALPSALQPQRPIPASAPTLLKPVQIEALSSKSVAEPLANSLSDSPSSVKGMRELSAFLKQSQPSWVDLSAPITPELATSKDSSPSSLSSHAQPAHSFLNGSWDSSDVDTFDHGELSDQQTEEAELLQFSPDSIQLKDTIGVKQAPLSSSQNHSKSDQPWQLLPEDSNDFMWQIGKAHESEDTFPPFEPGRVEAKSQLIPKDLEAGECDRTPLPPYSELSSESSSLIHSNTQPLEPPMSSPQSQGRQFPREPELLPQQHSPSPPELQIAPITQKSLPPLNPGWNELNPPPFNGPQGMSSLDLDILLEALQTEINQDYDRFYGS